MLYTGRGDSGKTSFFGESQRSSKASLVAEALGTLDELNSYLGLCKIKVATSHIKLEDFWLEEILRSVQGHLFIIQASLAGAEPIISEDKIKWQEDLINSIEEQIPPVRAFIIAGGSELSAMLDVARTLTRQAERRVVAVKESDEKRVNPQNLAYLNRLSSLLYALARYSNFKLGIKEDNPTYD